MSNDKSLEFRLVQFTAMAMNLREKMEPLTDNQSFHVMMLLDSAEKIAQSGLNSAFDILFRASALISDFPTVKK